MTSKTAYVCVLLKEALSELDEQDPIIDQLIDLLTHLKNAINKKGSSTKAHNFPPQTSIHPQQYKSVPFLDPLKKSLEVKVSGLDQLSYTLDPTSCKNSTMIHEDFSIIQDLTSPKQTQTHESTISTPKSTTQSSSRNSSQVAHSYFKSLNSENKVLENKNTLDLSNQIDKLTKVPMSELIMYGENLMNLNLSGNSIPKLIWDFPISLTLLNISHNELTEISFPKPLPNLKLLNISHNKIRRTSGIQMCKSLEEVYFSHNCLIGVATICQLGSLNILDISYNNIANCEDVATLSICPRLTVLNLKGNPLSSRDIYTENIKSLLSKIQVLDPECISEFSRYERLRDLLFSELKGNQEAISLTIPNSKIQTGSGKVLKKDGQIIRKHILDDKLSLSIPVNLSQRVSSFKGIIDHTSNYKVSPGVDSYSEPATQRSPQTPSSKIFERSMELPLPIREITPKRILRSANQSNHYNERTPSNQRKRPSSTSQKANLIREISQSDQIITHPSTTSKPQTLNSTLSFISQAENRLIQAVHSEDLSFTSNYIDQDHKPVRKFTLVTQESINKLNKVHYGNPIAAMMIGPAVVTNRLSTQARQNQKRKTTPVSKVSLSNKR